MGNEEYRKTSEQIGTLGGCLIEGDSEQKARERKVKRRALAVSIGLQSAAIVALVVTPLLAKPEKLAFLITTPMPPYRAVRPKPVVERTAAPTPPRPTGIVIPTHIPTGIVTRDPAKPTGAVGNDDPNLNDTVPVPGVEGSSRIFDGHKGPVVPWGDQDKTKRVSVGGAVQQAMLVRRVEPSYPQLARTLHRAGQVHIKAVISMDGNVESLQVLDGDPLLVQSALEAVRQWRYKPTLLNGSPVEVETVVTVIYTLNQ